MKPSQVARRRPQHVVLFGDPGTGKSTLAAKLLLDGNFRLTWISLDNGHEVVFKLGIPLEVLDERLNLVILPDTKDNPVAIKTVLKIISGAPTNICDAHGEVDCIKCKGLKDAATWTRVCCNEFNMNEILVIDHLGQLGISAMTIAYKKARKADDEKPEWEQYGTQGAILEKILITLQQSKYHAICIAHAVETEMEDDSKKLVPVCGTTKFSRRVGSYFDHMIYANIKNSSHRFTSNSTKIPGVVTKSRSDIVIEDMKEPSLVPFFDGTILPPESSDTKDAAKVLSSLSQKVTEVSEEPAANLEVQQTEKEIVKIEIPETISHTVEIPTPKIPIQVTSKPTQDRSALLAKLALMNKGNR